MYVEISKESDDRLVFEKWTFYVRDENNKLLFELDGYVLCGRETKRHKLKISKRYYRLSHRDSTVKKEDVPITSELVNEVKDIIISKILYKTN